MRVVTLESSGRTCTWQVAPMLSERCSQRLRESQRWAAASVAASAGRERDD